MNSVSRLTKIFAPEHYDLSVTLDRPGRSFSGTVTIQGLLSDDASFLPLHAKDLEIHSATLDGKEASFTAHDNDELHITHPDLAGGKHILVVSFSGTITNDMNGIYPCYYEIDGQKQELLATQFESHYARQAFPCVDEPEAKATFTVTLQTEQEVSVLGNMPVHSQKVEGEHLVTQFETTPRMSSYLVAWVVGTLHKKTAVTKSGVEVSVWATPAHAASHLDFALDIATRTIDFFEEYFGVPYPLPKSDHVALPDFSAGAMENWGLITYREIVLLADPEITTLSAKQNIALVVAHELSHQWFGNLVTMKWWNDLWLNESFANLMEYIAIDALEPGWDIWLDYATSSVISALRRDAIDGVQSVQVDVQHPDEISTLFDPSIVYAKGSRLLRMLEAHIGEEALRSGLRTYFEAHAYTNTEAQDLWAALSAASGKDVGALMQAWITQPGYPLVSVSKKGSELSLSQKQFFVGPHAASSRIWPIPLHSTSDQLPALMDQSSLKLGYAAPSAPRLNAETTAHFIAQYDSAIFEQHIKDFANFSAVDRLTFIQDQILLSQAGEQSTAQLIPLIKNLNEEPSEAVWTSISIAINELKRFVDNDEVAEKQLRSLVRALTQYHYDRLGWDASTEESENDTKLRSTIISLSLYGENSDAQAEATRRYESQAIEELDKELRVTILAYAVREHISDDIVDVLLAAHNKTASSELQEDLAAALTSTRSPEVIARLISLLKDASVVRPQDFTHWYVWLLRNRFGREKTWQWTLDTWPWIEATFKGDSHYDMFPRYIAGSLNTQKQLEEFTAFFAEKRSQKSLERTIDMGITELQGRLELLARDTPLVIAALANQQ